jgi:hypothetical protein
VDQSPPDRDHLLAVAGGVALAAGLGVIAFLMVRNRRSHNPLSEANRLIQSLNEKIGELEGHVQALRPAS